MKNEILEKSNFTRWKNHHVPRIDNVLVFWEAAGMAGKSKTAATRIKL